MANPIRKQSNVIKLAAKKEAAEGHRIPKEIQKKLIRKKRQQKQTEAAPSENNLEKVSERRHSRRKCGYP